MRIISQNGMSDYPYDHIVVYVNHLEHNKIGATVCGDSYDIELAEYDSEDDAKFVLEMIGAAYMLDSRWMHMPDAEQARILRTSYLENRKDEECYYRYLKRMGAHAV